MLRPESEFWFKPLVAEDGSLTYTVQHVFQQEPERLSKIIVTGRRETNKDEIATKIGKAVLATAGLN